MRKVKNPTARGTWKARERVNARFFGSERKPFSGSGGRNDETTSDSMHPRLYIESKLRSKFAVISLYDETKEKAMSEGKIPLCCLCVKGRPGMWVLCHAKHLQAIAEEVAQTVQLRFYPVLPGTHLHEFLRVIS